MEKRIIQDHHVINKTSLKTIFLKLKAMIEKNDSRKHFQRIFDMESTRDIKIFNYDCRIKMRSIPKADRGNQNAVLAAENMGSVFIPFYPHNDGMTTLPFVFFRKELGKEPVLFMDNRMDFTEVKNLGQVLIKLIAIMHEAYNKHIPIHPFESFLLEFPFNVTKETIFKAKLAMCIPNIQFLDLNKGIVELQNVFLDHFLGWNFGDIIRGNKELETIVLDYHRKMIKEGKREDAGSGFEVTYRTSDTNMDNFYLFCFPGMEIDPPYLFSREKMKWIKDEKSYLELLAQKYSVSVEDVEKAVKIVIRHTTMLHVANDYHPEPYPGSLGWLHTPKGSCNICLTKDGHRMINGLEFLKGNPPKTQISKTELDRP